MSYSSDVDAIRAVQDRLVEEFCEVGGAYIDNYPVEGIEVVMIHDEPNEEDRAGKAYILLVQRDGGASEWAAADDDIRDVELDLAATANDFNGSLVGAENETAIEEIMSGDIVREFRVDNKSVWESIGIFDVRVKPGVKVTKDGTRIIPHRLTFKYEVS